MFTATGRRAKTAAAPEAWMAASAFSRSCHLVGGDEGVRGDWPQPALAELLAEDLLLRPPGALLLR